MTKETDIVVVGDHITDEPQRWEMFPPKEYLNDSYQIEVDKSNPENVKVKITSVGLYGSKEGVAFGLNKRTNYLTTAAHLEAAFKALFRHRTTKILDALEDI